MTTKFSVYFVPPDGAENTNEWVNPVFDKLIDAGCTADDVLEISNDLWSVCFHRYDAPNFGACLNEALDIFDRAGLEVGLIYVEGKTS